MLQGRLQEDGQAIVELEVVCRDESSRTVPAVIDTGFNGQVSLSRQMVSKLDLSLIYEGTIEVELAGGNVIEENIYSGTVRFDGQEVVAEILLTGAADNFIGTGLLTGKALQINFVTHEVTVTDHVQ